MDTMPRVGIKKQPPPQKKTKTHRTPLTPNNPAKLFYLGERRSNFFVDIYVEVVTPIVLNMVSTVHSSILKRIFSLYKLLVLIVYPHFVI